LTTLLLRPVLLWLGRPLLLCLVLLCKGLACGRRWPGRVEAAEKWLLA
jgi:hypothetical protein